MSVKSSFDPLSAAELTAAKKTAAAAPVVSPIFPVPDGVEEPHAAAARLLGRNPDGVWLYRNTSGALLHAVVRSNHKSGKGGKSILPLSWCRSTDNKEDWAFKHLPVPRPLYGLDQLAARPYAPVVIVEGEKAADAARDVFPDSVIITSSGGASAAKQADWTPISSRSHVLLWPDADKAGRRFADEVASHLSKLGVKIIRIVDPNLVKDALGESKPKPEGWDVVDAIADGWSPASLRVAAFEAGQNYQPKPQYLSFGSFVMSEADGLILRKEGDEGEAPEIISISGAFEIIGRGRDKSSQEWFRYLRWYDDDGREHLHQVKDADIHADARQLAAALASNGLRISTASRAHLLEYLNRSHVDRRITVVHHTGWHTIKNVPVFVLPQITLGERGNETVVLDAPGPSRYESKGTAKEWFDTVGALSKGQQLLVVAISTALAGPLLHFVGQEGGGVNYFGESSRGKSTSGEVAASVWGKGASPGYVASWRATANGLEAAAALASDTCLILDEVGVIEGREVAAAIYQLVAGTGKTRSKRDGSMRESKTWRVMVFSTGEMPMTAKISEDRNRRAQAGQQVRMLDVPADARAGLGVFNTTGPFTSAAALADALKSAARTTFGTAGPAFIERLLAADQAQVSKALRASVAAFVERHAAKGSDGQVLRVAQKVGLIGAAGELAREFDIVPWNEGEAFDSAAFVFNAWLDQRGGSGAAESRDAIARVRFFIETHGDSRFETTDKESDERSVVNRAGWKKGQGRERRWMVPTEIWKQEICSGRDPVQTARALADAGYLEREGDGFMKVHKIDGRPQRAYTITAAILEAN